MATTPFCSKWLFVVGINFLIVLQAFPQNVRIGILYMTGNSRGIDNSSAISNAVEDFNNGFVQPGVYAIINYRPDSSNSYFKLIRADLGVASRTGTFDLGSANLARITTNSIDLTVLLPISFATSPEIEGFAAIGPVLSYQLKRNIIATSIPTTPVEMKTLNPGFALELGFRWRGSFISYRTMTQFGDYACRVGAITFGFCPIPWTNRK